MKLHSFYFARSQDFLEAGAVSELSASESTIQKYRLLTQTEARQLFWVRDDVILKGWFVF